MSDKLRPSAMERDLIEVIGFQVTQLDHMEEQLIREGRLTDKAREEFTKAREGLDALQEELSKE